MDLAKVAKSTCWQVKLPQNLLARLENVSGEFHITSSGDASNPGSKIVQIVIDDELSRMAKGLHILHEHKIADNVQTCPESLENIDLSHIGEADRAAVRESHKNITWQRTVFRARHSLQFTGLILPAIDGLEPALWPNATVLLHRLKLNLHALYNSHNIPAKDLQHAICVQESERAVSGVFYVDQMHDSDPSRPSWTVCNKKVERLISKRLTVYSNFQYCSLEEVPVTKMGHRRLEILMEGILRQQVEATSGSTFHGLQLLQDVLRTALQSNTDRSDEVPEDFVWKQLCGAKLVLLASHLEAMLRADSPLARRRILQFLCSSTIRQSIYSSHPLFNVESNHVFRSQKISLGPGIYALFICVSDSFREENMTVTQGNVFFVLYGSSITLNALEDLYHEENLLRSIHSKELIGSNFGPFYIDQQFFLDRYNLHKYQSNKAADLEQAAYATPFIIPEDKTLDTIDLAPAMYAGTNTGRRRRKTLLKNSMDDSTLEGILLRKFHDSSKESLQESEIFDHFGDSLRVKTVLNKIAMVGQSSGRHRSWTLRQEFT